MKDLHKVLLFYLVGCGNAWNTQSRRNWIQKTAEAGVVATAGAWCWEVEEAAAARGAAELDFEYYVRSAVSGNKKEGNVLPSTPPDAPPPRTIRDPLLGFLLNQNCSASCIPTSVLIATRQKATLKQRETRPGDLEEQIQKQMSSYRERASNSFFSKAPWLVAEVSDQYYFDLTSYALWRTASDLLPNYRDRDDFLRELGRQLYEKLKDGGLLKPMSGGKGSAVSTLDTVSRALQLLMEQGYCKGYRLGESLPPSAAKGKALESFPLFDELDDDALAAGASVNALVSVFEPATLGASLQITGEQSRFSPDFVGPLLAAVWEEAGLSGTWETFFVDPEYRPNPKDYFPNEQLLQFSLTLAN